MRIVIDTNVLISGIFWGGIPAEIIHAWEEGRCKVICSAEIITEYGEVLRRVNPGLEPSELDQILSFLISSAEIVQPAHWFKIVPEDPGDDKFLDCAFQGQAHVIISGDKHLLQLERFGPIHILSPSEFKKKFPHILAKA